MIQAIEETSAWWSAVFKEATLLLHIYFMHKCLTGQRRYKENFTFFTQIIACVTRSVPLSQLFLKALLRPKLYSLPLSVALSLNDCAMPTLL